MEDETDESWTRGGSCGMFTRLQFYSKHTQKTFEIPDRVSNMSTARLAVLAKMPVAAVKVAATELTRIHTPRSSYAEAPSLK